MKDILAYVHETRGTDFSRYRQATVTRMLGRRMQETGRSTPVDYLNLLKTDPEELQNLLRTLTVKVSSFFRNPLIFELIQSYVIPDIVQGFGSLNAWSIGCANGEEPYSIAICVRDMSQKERLNFPFRIIGSDMDPNALAKAERAEYAEEELDDVKKRLVDACFEEPAARGSLQGRSTCYRLKQEIADMVCFSCGDMAELLRKESTARFNLILCRNVLIYMNLLLQQELLESITGVLLPKGYLVLGESETLPDPLKSRFTQPFPGAKIYRKKAV